MACLKREKTLQKDIAEGITTLEEKLVHFKNLFEESLLGEVPIVVKEIDLVIKDIQEKVDESNSLLKGLCTDVHDIKAALVK